MNEWMDVSIINSDVSPVNNSCCYAEICNQQTQTPMKDILLHRLLDAEKYCLKFMLTWILTWKCVLKLCYNKDIVL